MGIANKRRTGGSGKNVSYFSHEFIIQNHGDIVTCVLMVFILGLMFQVTSPLASVFISPKYNVTDPEVTKNAPTLYTYGLQDLGLVFFYSLACIVFHAVIQEYVLDKLIRKTRLSKTNSSKFNESGQLVAFYLVSLVWLANIFKDEGYFRSLNFFYEGYPHVGMTAWTKLFFAIQLSYWVHVLPELYFQKVKKEEWSSQITTAVFNFILIDAIYLLNLQRVGLTLIALEYLIQLFFHAARLLNFFGKSKTSKLAFNAYNLVFFVGRAASSALAVLVFWFGLKSSSVDRIDFTERNFNTQLTRYTCLGVVLGIQAYFVLNFFSYLFKRSEKSTVKRTPVARKPITRKGAASRETSDAEVNEQDQQSDVSPPPSPNGKVKAN